jgi:hypothetical protein
MQSDSGMSGIGLKFYINCNPQADFEIAASPYLTELSPLLWGTSLLRKPERSGSWKCLALLTKTVLYPDAQLLVDLSYDLCGFLALLPGYIHMCDKAHLGAIDTVGQHSAPL